MASEGVSAREIPVALEVSTICKSFGQHKVLKGISLTAREHDVVAILGSSGSIGTQALDVIRANPRRFDVVGLAVGSNRALLEQQAAAAETGSRDQNSQPPSSGRPTRPRWKTAASPSSSPR